MATRRTHTPHSRSGVTVVPCPNPAVIVDKHPIGIILPSNPIKDIRFSLSKEHWKGTQAYAQLPATIHGKITAWSHGGKEGVHISAPHCCAAPHSPCDI